MKIANSRASRWEILVWILGIATQQVIFCDLLWRPLHTFVHDSYAWGVPILTFVTRLLWEGEWPLWNPYSLGGHPFYPSLTQFRLLDPVVTFLLWVFKFFTSETILAIHWNRYLLLLLNSLGVYWWLRSFARNLVTRIVLVPLLLFSPFFWISFHQDGFLNQYLWFPFLLLVLTKVVERERLDWDSTFLIALLLGLSMQSYFFSCTLTVLFLGSLLALFLYPGFQKVLKSSGTLKKGLVLGLLLFGFSLPNLTTMLQHTDFVYPMRSNVHFEGLLGGKEWQGEKKSSNPLLKVEKESMKLDYLTIERSGAFFLYWDWIRAFTPEKNYFYAGTYPVWGHSSEGYLYLGCLGWVLMLLGMVKGKDPKKPFFLFLLALLFLLSLGPRGVIHRVLYEIFPPLWFVRNLHGFILFLYTCVLYFFVLGTDWLVENSASRLSRLSRKALFLGLVGGIALGLAPAFKPPVHWIASLPLCLVLVFAYRKRSFFSSKDFFVALVLSHAVSVLITLGFNAPLRILPVLSYWLGVGGGFLLLFYLVKKVPNPSALSFVLVFFISGELLFAALTSTWSMPISPLVDDLLRKNPSSKLIERELIPPLGLGCNENWRNCFHSVELLNETRYAFTSLEEKHSSPLMEDSKWIRKQTFHPTFFVKKNYVKLLLSDLPDKSFKETLAIRRSPFRCGEACEVSVKASSLNALHLQVEAKETRNVQWAQNFDLDWKAKVNGSLVPIQASEEGFSYFEVPNGKSEVFLSYQPRGFLISLSIYYFLILLCLVFARPKPSFAS